MSAGVTSYDAREARDRKMLNVNILHMFIWPRYVSSNLWYSVFCPLCELVRSHGYYNPSEHDTIVPQVGYIEHGVIVHGAGLDEISPLGNSKVIEIKNTAGEGQPKKYETSEYIIDPEDYGFPGCTMEDLKGGERDENAQLLREALEGGAWTNNGKKDAITLNAGMGLYVYGLAPTIEAAFKLARTTLESGAGLTQVCGADARLRAPLLKPVNVRIRSCLQ